MKTKKQKVKQQIIAVMVMAFMFVMITGTLNIPDLMAATTTTMAFGANISAGTLNIDTLASLAFPTMTIAVPTNDSANLTVVNMQDYRGNGMGWTMSAYSTPFTTPAGGTNSIANTAIFINTGTLTNISGTSTGVAATGAGSWRDLSAARTLVNTASNNGSGMGSYNLANTMMNIVYGGNPAQTSGVYTGTLTLTIASL